MITINNEYRKNEIFHLVLDFRYKIKFIVTFDLIQLDTRVGIIEKKEAIQLLKTNIQSELGKTITTRRHCEELEFEVLRKTGIKLSYNTIRRFFNLAGERSISQPTVATLDVLSNYSGFRDFHSLKIGMTKSESLESLTPGQINILSGIFHLTGKQKEKLRHTENKQKTKSNKPNNIN